LEYFTYFPYNLNYFDQSDSVDKFFEKNISKAPCCPQAVKGGW